MHLAVCICSPDCMHAREVLRSHPCCAHNDWAAQYLLLLCMSITTTRRTMLARLHVISTVEVRQGCIFCWLCASAMCAHAQAPVLCSACASVCPAQDASIWVTRQCMYQTCFGRLCFFNYEHVCVPTHRVARSMCCVRCACYMQFKCLTAVVVCWVGGFGSGGYDSYNACQIVLHSRRSVCAV